MVRPKRKKRTGNKVKSVASTEVQKLPESVVKEKEEREDALIQSSNTPGGNQELLNEVEDYAIILLDLEGKIITWNKGAEKIKGYSAKEIIGKNYRIFYSQEDREQNLSAKLLNEARQKGRTSYEGWRVRKDGTRFWGNMTLTAFHNQEGDVIAFLKMTRDVTEKKIAEDHYSNFVEELKLKNEELKKSEERYHKMIAEVLDYAIILLDKDGKILDWNKGAEKLKGYTAEEIVGKSFRLFYPKEEKDANLPEQLLEEAVKNGSVVHEGWRIRKDGKRFWGNIVITALHDENNNIIGFSKVTRDLTDKKIAEDKVSNVMEELRQANEQLKQSEERYHKMIEEVQDYAIILLNLNGEIQNWNTGAEFIKGYNAKEIIGKSFKLFYTKEDRDNKLPDSLLARAREEGKVNHEGWRVRKDGTLFWGSVVITALHGANGDLIGFSKVTRDLTERKQVEDALKSRAAQLDLKNKTLERLNEELSSFTHVASHDMKEPLRKIQTFAGRIEEIGFAPEKSKEYIGKIMNSVSRMQNLIDDLLSYSRVSNDIAKFEKVDLNNTLQAVKTDLEIPISEKHAVVESNQLPVVQGVGYQLHQVFLNLISNAIKFAKPDSTPLIQIHATIIKGPDLPEVLNGDNEYFHITISDNGIGFNQEDTGKIFEAFQRLHPKHVFAGTGIGLAIVKKVMENHNGIVSAEGVQGVGATFHLYFPSIQKN
ncbi:PAS domain-containing sensor histidine kinase [Chryseosolibacter indicus]|uniref:histidine kinase n=1 Tax=Chryseosolibacter indicus TaxID=2782351 RepID=A0ABS5VTL9_9BACT|nr:PAS domain-containing sensor histidine kinase [Chryseosolibacter indicus]MBT1704773.1 PAS domain S-box protein [Chryseosolibacter indicus]